MTFYVCAAMVVPDVLIGLVVGSILGCTVPVVLRWCFRYGVQRIAPIFRSHAVTVLVATVFSLVPTGALLLLTLALRPIVMVWNTFLAGWVAGMIVAMLITRALRRR